MTSDTHQKGKTVHLQRNAYLYIRQSTLRQVFENSESTKRQYALRQKAVALGWPEDRIIALGSDLGQSGASAPDPLMNSIPRERNSSSAFTRFRKLRAKRS